MRSILRPVVAIFALSISLSAFARAADPIEFTFGGTFTQTTGTVHQVGQPFTSVLLFDPAVPDANPSTIQGEYRFIRWSAPSATFNPIVFNQPPVSVGQITVGLTGGAHTWRVQYVGAIPFAWTIQADFPVGTFANDSLPLSLDLAQSSQAFFRGFDGGQFVDLQGNINSLTVRTVPEPITASFLAIGIFCARRFARERCFN